MNYRQWVARDLQLNTYLEQMLQMPIYKARQILNQSKLNGKEKVDVWETYRSKRYLDKFAKRNPVDTKLPNII